MFVLPSMQEPGVEKPSSARLAPACAEARFGSIEGLPWRLKRFPVGLHQILRVMDRAERTAALMAAQPLVDAVDRGSR